MCDQKHGDKKNRIASEVKQDDRDCLSDSHRDYMQRNVEYELAKQEQASRNFLRARFKSSVSQAE
jgi:hypothetical protein